MGVAESPLTTPPLRKKVYHLMRGEASNGTQKLRCLVKQLPNTLDMLLQGIVIDKVEGR